PGGDLSCIHARNSMAKRPPRQFPSDLTDIIARGSATSSRPSNSPGRVDGQGDAEPAAPWRVAKTEVVGSLAAAGSPGPPSGRAPGTSHHDLHDHVGGGWHV